MTPAKGKEVIREQRRQRWRREKAGQAAGQAARHNQGSPSEQQECCRPRPLHEHQPTARQSSAPARPAGSRRRATGPPRGPGTQPACRESQAPGPDPPRPPAGKDRRRPHTEPAVRTRATGCVYRVRAPRAGRAARAGAHTAMPGVSNAPPPAVGDAPPAVGQANWPPLPQQKFLRIALRSFRVAGGGGRLPRRPPPPAAGLHGAAITLIPRPGPRARAAHPPPAARAHGNGRARKAHNRNARNKDCPEKN